MSDKQTAIIDTIKAWAFPCLVAVIGFFGKQTITKQDQMNERLQQALIVLQRVEDRQENNTSDMHKTDARIVNVETRIRDLELK